MRADIHVLRRLLSQRWSHRIVGTVEVTIDPVYEYLMLTGSWFDNLLTCMYSTNHRTKSFDSTLMIIMTVLLMVMLMFVELR
jgi:hypothetical protein